MTDPTEPLWRPSLALALYRNRHVAQSRYLQLATVRHDGRPANRTVVFRGFLGQSDQITAVTDLRSAKAREIQASPWAEACWYFPMTREQFRLSGRVTVVGEASGDDEVQRVRRNIWRELSEATRHSFTWPTPAAPRDPSVPFIETPTDPDSPLKTFGLLVLNPVEVDHLELDGNPQNRWNYRRDDAGRWSAQEIHP